MPADPVTASPVPGSSVLHVLDAAAVRRWCADGCAALGDARAEIDALNVYPVPDGDTGTNLLLTLESVVAAVGGAGDDLPAVAAALASGALTGARGNSGALLSQLLRGFAEVLAAGPADGPGVADALARGVALAYAGVADPVEGTLLSVARAAADRAAGATAGALADVVAAACTGAAEALRLTQQQLPVLREAGVVDAGGRGWVVLLEALAGVVQGRLRPISHTPAAHAAPHDASAYGGPAYEVQYLLAGASDDAAGRLRDTLGALGDSVVVVGGGGLLRVHAHVDDIGAALEAGVEAGRPSRIEVTRFADGLPRQAPGRAVVVVCEGAGLVRLLREAGAVPVQGRPTTAQLWEAVRATGCPEVVLLPGAGDGPSVARAARAEGVDVQLVPTRSAVQALSALAVADPARPAADDAAAMRQAAVATRTGEVTTAVQGATTAAGVCLPGDALGVVDGSVVVVGADVGWVALRLLERLAESAELVTVVLGGGAPEGLTTRLREVALAGCPHVELVVIDGGQPHPPVLFGAE